MYSLVVITIKNQKLGQKYPTPPKFKETKEWPIKRTQLTLPHPRKLQWYSLYPSPLYSRRYHTCSLNDYCDILDFSIPIPSGNLRDTAVLSPLPDPCKILDWKIKVTAGSGLVTTTIPLRFDGVRRTLDCISKVIKVSVHKCNVQGAPKSNHLSFLADNSSVV